MLAGRLRVPNDLDPDLGRIDLVAVGTEPDAYALHVQTESCVHLVPSNGGCPAASDRIRVGLEPWRPLTLRSGPPGTKPIAVPVACSMVEPMRRY
jgi:hypothetical protein